MVWAGAGGLGEEKTLDHEKAFCQGYFYLENKKYLNCKIIVDLPD